MIDIKNYKFKWNIEKNNILKESRKISFEIIEKTIKMGGLIDIIPHHNKEKYPNQKIFAVLIENYIWSVPFIQSDKVIFLKTAFKDRELTRFYLGKNN